MRNGWKTSEFWLSLFAMIIGAVQASGLIEGSDTTTKIVGLVVSILGALGYAVPRVGLKQAEVKAAAVLGLHSADVKKT